MTGKTAAFRVARGFSLGTETGENSEVSTSPLKFEKASSGLTGFAQGLFTAVA
jgi:hypothetical protein